MKRFISAFLAIVMVLALIPYGAISLFAETDSDKAGLTFSGTSYGADEDYRLDKNLEEVPHTFTAWVYIPNALYSQRHIILGNYPSLSRYTGYLNFEIQTNGRPRLVIGDGSKDSAYQSGDQVMYDYVFDNAAVPADTWTQITIVSDEARQELRCYLNGVLKQTITDNFAPIDPTSINHTFMMGGDFRQSGNKLNQYYYKGQLKDVYLYSDVRTADEIASDYANGPDLDNAHLICAYDIDADDHGKDIEDISGNGYTMYYNKMWLTEEEMIALRGDTSDRAYSFAVVPDIQYMTEWRQEALAPLYQWIVDNVDDKNIKLVMGLGDITNTDTDIDAVSTSHGVKEWETVYNVISKLNGVVPYTLVRGNHDIYDTEPKDTATPDLTGTKGQGFIKYFGGTNFYAQQFKNPNGYEAGYYEGTLANSKGVEETDEVVNAWMTVEADGDKWLIMALDWGAHDSVLAWASDIIEAHPNHRVIITTHNYLSATGDHTDNRLSGDITSGLEKQGFNNGDGIWDKLVSRHSNIELTLSGHISASNIVIKQNEGVYGNTVTQMLIDAQEMDRYWYNPEKGKVTGVGAVAMLYVSKDGKTIDTEYYSTVTGKYLNTMSQRTVDLDAKGTIPDTKWDGYSQFAPAGSGTAEDPYIITCAENLQWMAKSCAFSSGKKINPFQGKYFKQTCDIDLNGKTLAQIGSYYKSSAYAVFGGIYDGQGYRIYNGYLKDNASASQNENWGVGIFGYAYSTDSTAKILNVVADNITAQGITAVGIIAGKVQNAQIENCVVTDSCKVIGTGTKQGVNTSTSVINNKVPQWNVYTQNRLGGIVGHAATGGHTKHCVSSATIHTNGNNAFAGGIVGSIASSPNVQNCVFSGKIINDFTDTAYFREIEGENVNGGIIGYMGSGSYAASGNRYHTGNINRGSFEIRGTATTDVVYGGIVGAAKELGATSHRITTCYNLSADITLGDQPENITVYVGGMVGRATPKDSDAVALQVSGYSVDLPNIKNGGLNVDTSVYTTGTLFNETTVTSGTKAISSTATVASLETILKTTDAKEATYASTRAKARDTKTLEVIGIQRSVTDGDKRVRLIFGVNAEPTELQRYGFEMTLSYADAAGDVITKHANVESYSVFTSLKGGDKDYTAGVDYDCKYFATLVIDPTVNGSPIAEDAIFTVTAYTVGADSYRHSYGAEMITVEFDGNGNLISPVAG